MTPSNQNKTLLVITGPTATGKTDTSIGIARELGAEIISADARQFYRELSIGTAAPTPEQLSAVKHHLVGHISINDYYNASLFEQQALERIHRLFETSEFVVLCGGSGLYIDAVCSGIDNLPDIHPLVRHNVKKMLQQGGLTSLQHFLQTNDPEYFAEVDKANPNRMMRGVEIFLATGQKFSDLRKKQPCQRPFKIKKVVLCLPRPRLFHRINQRTDAMVQQGIIEEAIRFFPHRHLNALNTVGYKELFSWIAGEYTLAEAIEKIRTNTRRYAKRQITWFKKYDEARWYLPGEIKSILRYARE